MKKQYIQPESHVVVVKLFDAVLNTNVGFGTASQGADELSREDQYNNRFEDASDEEDWDWE